MLNENWQNSSWESTQRRKLLMTWILRDLRSRRSKLASLFLVAKCSFFCSSDFGYHERSCRDHLKGWRKKEWLSAIPNTVLTRRQNLFDIISESLNLHLEIKKILAEFQLFDVNPCAKIRHCCHHFSHHETFLHFSFFFICLIFPGLVCWLHKISPNFFVLTSSLSFIYLFIISDRILHIKIS